MARRRMYVFERAYRDFFGRLRALLGSFLGGGRRSWHWFYDGVGARVWDVLLRIGVVASTVWMCVLYLRYESVHGRSFSGQTLIPLAFIFIYAIVLLWSWKAPVHFATKVLSAISAMGVMVLLAAALAIVAMAVFLPYLAALCLLTLLSLLVFLPMRLAHWIWLVKYRITYKCPYDDDPRKGVMPIHVCSCGHEYADLQPSFYGIFHHVCRHEDGDVKLPTLDILGRNKLARLCGGCHRPLLHSSAGQLREWPIFIMGGPNVGKSVYLAQAIRRLCGALTATKGSVAELDSPQQQREHERQLQLLDSGQRLPKTAELMTAYGLAVRVPNGLRALVYLFDKPGEYFERMRDFGRMQAIQNLKGILLLVDPFSLPALDDYASQMSGQLQPSKAPFHAIAGNLIHAIEQMLPGSQYAPCTVPVAVVLSKADALPTGAYPFLNGLAATDHADPQAFNQRCREAMNRLGADASVRLLEQKFKNIRYFACSAMGRMPNLRDTSPFQPTGVEQPLLWLLGYAEGSSRPRPVAAAVRV